MEGCLEKVPHRSLVALIIVVCVDTYRDMDFYNNAGFCGMKKPSTRLGFLKYQQVVQALTRSLLKSTTVGVAMKMEL